jgi:hypothetical protein
MAFYRTLLGIRTVQAISENSIQLEYDVADRGVVTLLLEYDPSTHRLVDARVSSDPASLIPASRCIMYRMREMEMERQMSMPRLIE